MKNKHAGMIKGFTQLSKAWYGEPSLRGADYIDSVHFGFYGTEGGTTGEVSVKWINLSGKIVPQLTIFSDTWSALSQFHDLIDLLGKHDNEDPTPEQFCKFLLHCGFVDRTETVRS
ncbi:hypothetical protein FDC50_10245 [Clostridium botulinum]|nr:hypothetical protein KU41_17360 [Clostridium botulinum]MBY6804332.1 hypothetical protein [Clostridium botulinum]MBY6813295.1 hypothetical protein [Clostridium botulinum]MBY6821971.1 hypothetical protein [Clostridium botulinum]NFJ49906.1 hypothetical protein [Clostridium botulinum]